MEISNAKDETAGDDNYALLRAAEEQDFRATMQALRAWIAWALILGGICIVYAAVPLGVSQVSNFNGSSFNWNPDDAREAATSLRFLGAMLFVGGLLERALLHFRAPQSRQQIGNGD